ncbi:MAG: lysophospholipid acyltransferase family protein [Deltaproteobacteria bacterium]|nr:lysophospholipid acyltransferase family protein [Deltaproteobacteria bacterium]
MDFLVYIGFRTFVWFINRLPLNLALTLGAMAGAVAFRLYGRRRRMVVDNIMRAFGGQFSEEEAFSVARSFYRKMGLSIVEFARSERNEKGYIEGNVSFEGLENIVAALKGGKGVVLLGAHLGNWELLSASLSSKGYAMSIVARPLDNPYIDSYAARARTVFGNKVIDKKRALRKMMEVLKDNGILGILLDQRSGRKESVVVDFFDIPARASKGLAAIVMKTHSAVLPTFIHREGLSKHRVIVKGPIDVVSTGDKDADIKENTQRFTGAIEGFIRKHPEEWFWFHSRWEKRKKGL